MELSIMERHIATVTGVAVGASIIAATFAFAAVGGLSMLGLGAIKSADQTSTGPAPSQETPISADPSAVSTSLSDALVAATLGQPSTSSGSKGRGSAPLGIVASAPSELVAPADVGVPTAAPQVAEPIVTPVVVPIIVAVPTVAGAPVTAPATSPPTVPKTTAAPVTVAPTTTRPPGVPADWPANKAIPPMPKNCEQPQLELNGVWNCDD
jgi:hypothetical protein